SLSSSAPPFSPSLGVGRRRFGARPGSTPRFPPLSVALAAAVARQDVLLLVQTWKIQVSMACSVKIKTLKDYGSAVRVF
ncbi:unnamed protein product, partial [Tilletia controversa]